LASGRQIWVKDMNFDDQTDDGTLLRSYCNDGSGPAFETLVRRYGGMLCSVATRVTGRRELAEEVAQNVFTSLARKARSLSAGRNGRLAGWLHRAAVLEARHLLRGERRHERRIRAAEEERLAAGGGGEDDGILRSEIDGALAELARGDRDVLVWRFFNGLNFREIAARLGKTEAAAQKQGRRALDRLGVRLRGAGVAVPAAALSTFLGSGMSEAMPAAAASKIGAVAMSSVAGGGAGFPALVAGKVALGLGAAAILLVVIAHPGRVLAKERKLTEASRTAGGEAEGSPVSAIPSRDFTVDPSFRDADDVDLEELAEDLYRGARLSERSSTLRATATLGAIGRLPEDTQKALFERGAATALTPQRRVFLLSRLASIVAEHDAEWLLDFCFPVRTEVRSRLWLVDNWLPHGVLSNAGGSWAKRDPEAAATWLTRALGDNRFGTPNDGRERQDLTNFATRVSAHAWSKAQPLIERLLLDLQRRPRGYALREIPKQLDDDVELASFAASDIVRGAHEFKAGIFSGIGRRIAEREWAAVEAFADRVDDEPARRQVLIGALASKWTFKEGELAEGVDAMLAWGKEKVVRADLGYLVGARLGQSAFVDEKGVWIQAKRVAGELGYGEVVLGAFIAHSIGPGHPVRLMEQAVAELSDSELRAEVAYRAVAYIHNGSFNEDTLKGVGFTEGEIEMVRRRFEQ